MRPRHTGRAGRRRDGGVRQIRSNGDVSYPSVDLPGSDDPRGAARPDYDAAADDGRRLSPVRDTGLEIQTRVSRQQESAARRQRTTVIASVVGIAVLITAAIAWRYVSDRMAAGSPLTAETSAASTLSGSAAKVPATGTAPAGTAEGQAMPTPIFASYGKLKMHLPVPLQDLTEIGFHQASYAWALRLKTPMKDANLEKVVKNKTTGRDISKQREGDDVPLVGTVIRMWRNRPGRPDTAADVGALPGTVVLAPVSGTVVKIKSYKLYGKYDDYELHIHPDNTRGLDLVMIHLKKMSVEVGDHVVGGVTPVAKVRKFSDKFHDQLANYTHGGGDHVHINLNDADYKGYKGLIGAISVPRSGSTATRSAGASGGTTNAGSPSDDDADETEGTTPDE